MSLIIIVGLFFIIWSQQKIQNRLQVLEEQVLKKHELTSSVPEVASVLSPLPTPQELQPLPSPTLYEAPVFTPNVIASAPQKDLVKNSELFLYTWFKEHTLIKIGGVFFFLGALWFVSFAINEGWLIPEIRIALGFALEFS